MLRSRFLPVLGAFMLVPAILFADDPKTPQEKLEAQQKQIDEKLTRLLIEMASVKEKIQALEKAAANFDLSETNFRIAESGRQLQKKLDELNSELRFSLKPSSEFARMPSPGGKSESKKAAATGNIRLINDYFVPQQVTINDSTYVVKPGQIRYVNVPPGAFTYQIVNYHDAMQNRIVEIGKVFEIRTHP